MKRKDILVSRNEKVVRGMEGVIAAETSVSFVDGENGDLFYQGYNINNLAKRATYSEVVYLLWYGDLPTVSQYGPFRESLVSEMTLPKDVIKWMKKVPEEAHPMDVLRTCVSMLGVADWDEHDNSREANLRKALRITAKVPTIIAALHRSRRGEEIPEPDPKKSFARNFIDMFTGDPLPDDEVRVAELLLILHADHGLNASTFTARVTASTMADMYAAVTSAIGTLKGPLHGGANQRVMEMLEEIGKPEMVDEYIDGLISAGQRVMGFGHRVYRVEDPRATHLRHWAEELCQRRNLNDLYKMARMIERKVMKVKRIHPNVDFYSATVQHALGIPKEYYTCMFAASRVSGWVAHVMEQHAKNRLIRPTSKYTGQYGRRYISIERRSEPKRHEQVSERSDLVLSTD